ncbi:type VI secretion system baseplate subunit TssG [Helicobacter sp. 14348-15]|uniref:type VI secretion system baseplate subunit TssG n=1 Tax=Campylobacterales TaxID=213849 RepID=UPI000A3560B9|nr:MULTISPECIES: type VI secretion system baseplate subunit TssG [Campylobacterales]MCI2236790.1 type VI secretion system baseplate subunit TssG [Helicobacter sp. CaF467b]MCL9821805.1 type VI secretion system baseplate subunit TssG [Helicobacter colisuis]
MNSSYSFHKLLKKLLQNHSKKEIFLRANKQLKHPNKEIEEIKFNPQDKEFLIQVIINFMGLHGINSHLPSYMLDKLSRNEDNNEGWTLFFDFFNHYILWIFFEVVNLKNYPRAFQNDFSDSISKILFSMLGITDKNIARKYLPFSPLLLSLRRPKYYIEKVLQSNFNLHNKLSILENIPHRILIAKSQQNKLGIKNHILGKNFILGNKFLSYQNKIAILIQGIEYQEAIEYLPKREKHTDLKNSVMFLTNNEFCVDLYIKINYSDKLLFVLGDQSTAKLGWGKLLGKPKKDFHLMHIKLYE